MGVIEILLVVLLIGVLLSLFTGHTFVPRNIALVLLVIILLVLILPRAGLYG